METTIIQMKHNKIYLIATKNDMFSDLLQLYL